MSGYREESLHRIFQSSFVRRKGILGPGSDCAQLTPPKGRHLLQTVDQVIAGVHLEVDATPKAYARKLLRRTLSDLAAVGATPWTVSWTLALPPDWTATKIRQLAKAFLKEAEHFDVPVVGGDCSLSQHVVLTCTALGLDNGRVPGRDGARVGDIVLVTGKLGDAVNSGAHLLPQPRLKEGRRLVEQYKPHAMMDLSDGLARDLPRILQASEVGAEIELTALPLGDSLSANQAGFESAVGEGEDYELLIILSPLQAKLALQDRILRKVSVTKIGTIIEGSKLRWLENGRAKRMQAKGWEHQWG
ncbi:MAG: thiamine-phosphate kinase [Planctomycetota bacterium]|nr:MAG: thiamine-phosphate kinase [Planctomycetota bacterium]